MGTKDAIGTLRQWRDLAGIDVAKTDGQAEDQNDRVMTAFLETLIASPLYSAGNPLIRLHAPPWLAVTFGDGAGGGGAESQSQPPTRDVEDGQEQDRSPETPPQTYSPQPTFYRILSSDDLPRLRQQSVPWPPVLRDANRPDGSGACGGEAWGYSGGVAGWTGAIFAF